MNDPKEILSAKKLLFKCFRDQARLLGLKRNEEAAKIAHAKGERILKEEVAKVPVNIKIAKTHLLKGLWSAKFDFRSSIDVLIESY